MQSCNPIRYDDFLDLFAEQYGELSSEEKELFEQYRVSPWKAVIRRSEQAGEEYVYVVAQIKTKVLYYDDVEDGFNISEIDETGRILKPGGSQNTLKGAINGWFLSI